MSKKTIFGKVEFPSPLFCSADVLGKAVHVTIGKQAGTLTLPSLPDWEVEEDHLDKRLLMAPSEAIEWGREGPLYWGQRLDSPFGASLVKLALLKMDLRQDNFESASQEVYECFPAWIALFDQYVTLLTTKKSFQYVSDEPGHLELLTCKEGQLTDIPTTRCSDMNVYLDVDGPDKFLRFEQFEKAASYSSSNLSPRLEYKMLLQAYRAREEEDHRKAIVEAANALEISLTKRLKEEFQNQNISFGQALLNKYGMLNGKFELARVLGIQLPDKDYKRLVMEPRNDVVHKAHFPTRPIVNQYITEVEEILRLFSPVIYE